MLDSVLLNVTLNEKENKKTQVMSTKLVILRRKLHLIFTANERSGGVTNTTKCAPHVFEFQVTTEKLRLINLESDVNSLDFVKIKPPNTAFKHRRFSLCTKLSQLQYVVSRTPAAFMPYKRTSPGERKRMGKTIAISTAVVVIPVFTIAELSSQ